MHCALLASTGMDHGLTDNIPTIHFEIQRQKVGTWEAGNESKKHNPRPKITADS
jgi:hypothetical protein